MPLFLTHKSLQAIWSALGGCLVVFDELHLMPADKAFLTPAAACRLFRGLCQSVWMSATATEPLREVITRDLGAVEITLAPKDQGRIPALAACKRLIRHEEPLAPEHILSMGGRRLVVVNQVSRAQRLFGAVQAGLGDGVPVVLLHSRFFERDRTLH